MGYNGTLFERKVHCFTDMRNWRAVVQEYNIVHFKQNQKCLMVMTI